MSRVLLLAAALALVGRAAAESGLAGAEFLRLMTSPRAAGMGEAGVAVSDDALSAAALNPAGLARLDAAQAGLAYNRLYEDLSLQHLVLAAPTARWGAFGLAATLLRSEAISGYDNAGAKTAPVYAQDAEASALHARRLLGPRENRTTGLFAGAGLRYARSSLDSARSEAVMADAGALYAHALEPGTVTLGLSARALGQGPRAGTRRELPPTVYRAGAAYSAMVLGDPLTLAYDARIPNDSRLSHGAGLEYLIRRVMAWRLGYSSGHSFGNGFRFGVGFRLKIVALDYALSHYGDFGVTHLLGLSARFGAPLERTPALTRDEERALDRLARGRAKLRAKRHYEAALELNEALALDPHNKEALRLLREIRETLEGGR